MDQSTTKQSGSGWRALAVGAVVASLALAGGVGLTACGDDDNEGAAEEAGKVIDEGAQEAGQAAEKGAKEADQEVDVDVDADDDGKKGKAGKK